MITVIYNGTFLSTLPARGATPRPGAVCLHPDISIHAPREGSDYAAFGTLGVIPISIHAPREGSDMLLYRAISALRAISIHAPREGSDPDFCR